MAREAEVKLTEDLYKLIGCSRNASPEQILTEYRRKALLLHPDKGGQQPHGLEDEGCQLFQELQFAKDILSNPRKRRHYDLWLTIGTSEFTLTEWMNNQEKIQQTFHWGHQQEQAKLLPSSIDSDQTHEKNKASHSCWKSHDSSMTKAFRNYKI